MLTSHLEWHLRALDRSLRSPFADRSTVKQHHAALGEISNKLVNVTLLLFLICLFRNGHWSNWAAGHPSHTIFLNLKYPPRKLLAFQHSDKTVYDWKCFCAVFCKDWQLCTIQIFIKLSEHYIKNPKWNNNNKGKKRKHQNQSPTNVGNTPQTLTSFNNLIV